MPTTEVIEEHFIAIQGFFERGVAQRGTRSLRDGISIAIYLDGKGPVTLTKRGGSVLILKELPEKPDMSFWIPGPAVKALESVTTEDVGELGVEILKLMAHSDETYRVTAKVHIGPFDLLRNGYLSVLPLGGPTVMKFLASKGFTGIGKIKDAISRMRA